MTLSDALSPTLASTSDGAQSESAITPRRRVRVLFVNDTARNGGPGRSLYTILKFLDPQAVHRAVVLPRAGVIAELLEDAGVADELLFEQNLVENPIEPWGRAMERTDFDAPLPLKAARLAGNVGKGTAAVLRLASLVRRGKYDLVYCNGTNADFLGGALAWATGVPALWHVRYTSLPGPVRGLHDRLAASRGVARIVCVSHAAAKLFPHCPAKVSVINNALDTSEFSPGGVTPRLRSELGIARDAVVFGSQGRILPRKGYAEMVRAAARALAQMSDAERARARFVIVGDTPEDIQPDHLAECRALSSQLGVDSHVTFTGFRADVKPLVADFDVAVVPSVYPDPLPRAVIESMAMGKPVLAYDVGGVAEMLEDGVCGSLVRGAPGDVEALAGAMLRYMRDPELRHAQGRAARARIERRFDGAAHGLRIQNEIVRTAGLA
jgi:glycosyltransferase involved in cell wall biosynthesis